MRFTKRTSLFGRLDGGVGVGKVILITVVVRAMSY